MFCASLEKIDGVVARVLVEYVVGRILTPEEAGRNAAAARTDEDGVDTLNGLY